MEEDDFSDGRMQRDVVEADDLYAQGRFDEKYGVTGMSEFGRIERLFGLYLEGEVLADVINEELSRASEKSLEKLSREFPSIELGGSFRWKAVIPRVVYDDRELMANIKRGSAESFYLGCQEKDVSLDDLHGEPRKLYKAGKRIVDIPSESSGDFTPEREEAGVVQGRMGGIGFEEKDDAWSDLNPYWNK